jgi:hypothetical protein
VALLVDGDNLPPSFAKAILGIAGRLGRVDLRRVYAAETSHKGWDQALGFRVVRVAGAKNGTDLLLCIEATEMACRGGFDHFVIASDDRDFSHLACWLREQGFPVLGLGTAKSPEGWRSACSGFELLEAGPEVQERALSLTDLDLRLRAAIGGKVGRLMKELGPAMGAAGVATAPSRGWRAYLQTRPDLYDLDPKGPDGRVRWIGGRASAPGI